MSGIQFPSFADPASSLIMVLYGHYELARHSLSSIATSTEGSYEVIVVDNHSPDGAGARLRDEVRGARFILNDDNLGYGTAANLGVLHARGRHLGILNSDLEVAPDWLSPMVTLLDEDPRAGAVVPMYLRPDGRVQEAGVLMGADAKGYGYGDRSSPDDPEIAFRRDVDYGSAAALLIRRELFLRVGGFDPIYGTGYYEDADLCFTIREAGYRTVYEPRSRVTHVGQASFVGKSGQEASERNRPVFLERFTHQLAGRPLLRRPPFDPHKDLIARDWWAPERILILDRNASLLTMASEIQDALPDARVSWVALGDPFQSRRHPRVEMFNEPPDLPRWLENRRYHYGAVISDATTITELDRVLRRTQPQAVVGEVSTKAKSVRKAVPLSAPGNAQLTLAELGIRTPHCPERS